jgi:hypothetical protein
MIHYFDKGTPLTISMWDLSWLSANHKGGAYEHLERRVEEAGSRGYNTLRLDCFPSHILEGRSVFKKNWDPKTQLPKWGQTAVEFECNVLERLSYLAELCRKYDIWLGLDAWNKMHMIGHDDYIELHDEERTFTKLSETWVKAIRLMREEGVLERAVWIAPLNEVPHYGFRRVRSIIQLQEKRRQGDTNPDIDSEMDMIFKRINHWLGEAIKEEIQREHIPLSYSSLTMEKFLDRLTDIYDVPFSPMGRRGLAP